MPDKPIPSSPQREQRFDALIFDMDGTLTLPTLDFGAIRREIGIHTGDLTAEIAKLPAEIRDPERNKDAALEALLDDRIGDLTREVAPSLTARLLAGKD